MTSLRQDPLHAQRRLTREQLRRDELRLLRQLARDRRVASARMPEMIRTGPAAAPPRKAER